MQGMAFAAIWDMRCLDVNDRCASRALAGSTLLAALMVAWPTVASAGATPPCTQHVAQVETADDRRTTDEIERRIAADETTAPLASRIRVSTIDGVVVLRGSVERAEDRLVLASVAEGTPGVRRVEDRLETRAP
jgi:osmotically-inducible protein OsmY